MWTTVFTAPIARAVSSTWSRCLMTSSLWGMVTLAPITSGSLSVSMKAPSRPGSTGASLYSASSPRALKAALCIAGLMECSTG